MNGLLWFFFIVDRLLDLRVRLAVGFVSRRLRVSNRGQCRPGGG
jgi:hypothetical protein